MANHSHRRCVSQGKFPSTGSGAAPVRSDPRHEIRYTPRHAGASVAGRGNADGPTMLVRGVASDDSGRERRQLWEEPQTAPIEISSIKDRSSEAGSPHGLPYRRCLADEIYPRQGPPAQLMNDA